MAENRNDQQFDQSSFGQQQTRDSQQNSGGQNGERTFSESKMDGQLFEEDDPNTLWDEDPIRGSQTPQSDYLGSPMNREQFDERSSNPSSAQQGSQGRDEYASPDDIDELEDDELEDDEMISRVDEEDDLDILDDDENAQMNKQGF